jgi:hypothetical protein
MDSADRFLLFYCILLGQREYIIVLIYRTLSFLYHAAPAVVTHIVADTLGTGIGR